MPVSQLCLVMGEDSCRNTVPVDKKPNLGEMSLLRNGEQSFPNSATMSTCSEVDSESTSYADDDVDEDYQYGPGIVSKLRTKFLSITLKQTRGVNTSMRRSCSLENILDQKTSFRNNSIFIPPNRFSVNGPNQSPVVSSSWSNLKRAKSMDTLLLSIEKEQSDTTSSPLREANDLEVKKPREPKVIRRRDGTLNRSTVTITEEEFPKPDTVKTYKRMFEPAESKKASANSNVRRRPPVLRATAKSGSNSNLKPGSPTNNKLNGIVVPKLSPPISKSSSSAKETPLKDVVPDARVTNSSENPVEIESTESKEVVNLNKKNSTNQIPVRNDLICNGTVRAEAVHLKVKDEVAKRNLRSPKCLEGKPSIPLRKPSPLKTTSRPVIAQTSEQKLNCNRSSKEQKPAIPEKIVLKPNLNCVKTVENRINKTECKNKADLSITDSKPYLENGLSLTEDEDHKVHQQPSDRNIPTKPLLNGFTKPETVEPQQLKKLSPSTENVITNPTISGDTKETKRVVTNSGGNNSMVFDFRGKDVVSHLSVSPAPFGCKAAVRRRNVLIDGKESIPYLNGFANGGEVDSEDEDYMDYSVPGPCGLVFEGENIRVGKGSILATRNKDLKIHFDEDVEKNTFVYPSETSFLADDSSSSSSSSDFSSLDSMLTETIKITNGSDVVASKLPSNTVINSISTGGLMSYTPSVLRTVDNFQPGLFRAQDEKKKKAEETIQAEGEEENRERKDENGNDSDSETSMLKPADPEFISSWSLSASTSDLLF